MKLTTAQIDSRIQRFRAVCRERGLPLTPQRSAIYGFLAATLTHPSAQAMYAELKKDFPNLSLATVYKNLEALDKIGLIRKVVLRDGSARWDADISPHHHIINLTTGAVSDFFDAVALPRPALPRGLTLESASVHFYVRTARA